MELRIEMTEAEIEQLIMSLMGTANENVDTVILANEWQGRLKLQKTRELTIRRKDR